MAPEFRGTPPPRTSGPFSNLAQSSSNFLRAGPQLCVCVFPTSALPTVPSAEGGEGPRPSPGRSCKGSPPCSARVPGSGGRGRRRLACRCRSPHLHKRHKACSLPWRHRQLRQKSVAGRARNRRRRSSPRAMAASDPPSQCPARSICKGGSRRYGAGQIARDHAEPQHWQRHQRHQHQFEDCTQQD